MIFFLKSPTVKLYSIIAFCKRNAFTFLCLLFMISLLLFSHTCMVSVQNGLTLWGNHVVPTLFPFLIATDLLSQTNFPDAMSKLFAKIMPPLFHVPGCGAYAFILGIVSGYPIGAKIVTELRHANLCSKSEGERLLIFTNNSGPLFIIGTIGMSLFHNSMIGFLLLITHILSAISVGIIVGFFSHVPIPSSSPSNTVYGSQTFSQHSIGAILKESIIRSIKTILMIGGFIVFFSVVLTLLNNCHFFDAISYLFLPIKRVFPLHLSFIKGLLMGIFEITNGISFISTIISKSLTLSLCISAFLLGFGGISICGQVAGIVSNSDLSLKPYIYGKLLQGVIAFCYTYLFIQMFPFFQFNLP